MTCGIYQLTFSSGKRYIGQSVNIENRWIQHADKMRKGTAAKPMQQEYNSYGFPTKTILLECHKDHLDMMESMYINANMIQHRYLMLNTAIPQDYSNEQIAFISTHENYLKRSTFELMRSLHTCKDNVLHLEEEIDQLLQPDSPSRVLALKKEVLVAEQKIAAMVKVNQELARRANMTWFERLIS